MQNTLENHVAVISGGLGDIGQAVGRRLAALGANIALSDIRESAQASGYLTDIMTCGRRAQYSVVDISDAKAVEQWIASVEQTLGLPTLIVCNAAVVSIGNTLTIDDNEWAHTLRVNLDGAFFMARAAAARLVRQKTPGRIVFIGSWAAHAPHPQIIAYSVAKAGLRMLSKCMALDLAKHNILVNEVAPGYVDGGLVRKWYSKQPALRNRDAGRVPLGQLIGPDEVALEVSHLCDPAMLNKTGSVVLMDGGLSLVAPGQDIV